MNIALLGFGTVGKGVYEIIRRKATSDTAAINVSHILIYEGHDEKTMDIMTYDYEEILKDPACTTVVEVIGGIEPAHTYILKALRSGRNVVTANKAVVAAHMEEFIETARENDVQFRFEASCGGGIPWIHGLMQAKRIDPISRISGIFNGTSNYILDQMMKKDLDFDVTLKAAQEAGYAEADPSADIDGIDTANKAVISSSLAFETYCRRDFPMSGIRNLKKSDLDWFRERGQSIRLMMLSTAQDDRYCCVVEPMALSVHSLEANVPDNFNLTTLIGDTIGELKFYGQGAGSLPTGNAIVSDLIAICRQEPFDVPAMSEKQFDPSLLRGDYILRANGEIGEFHDMDPVQMHEQYRLTLQEDPDAFLVRLL